MNSETDEQKIPAQDLYQQLYKDLKISPRTVQWYATEGYIPKPEKISGEAFYSAAAQIPSRIRAIGILQKKFDLKLKQIKGIVIQQTDSDWDSVYNLLTALEELFPYHVRDYDGDMIVSNKGSCMAKIICFKLSVVPVDEISLADAEEEYDEVQKNDPESLDELPF